MSFFRGKEDIDVEQHTLGNTRKSLSPIQNQEYPQVVDAHDTRYFEDIFVKGGCDQKIHAMKKNNHRTYSK